MRHFLTALNCASDGICYGLKTQRHLRFHLAAGVVSIAAGVWKGLGSTEWLVLVLLIASVLAAELMNTAIESLVDLISPEYHQLAKVAKDTAAGAVLIVAVAALVIGLFLFVS